MNGRDKKTHPVLMVLASAGLSAVICGFGYLLYLYFNFIYGLTIGLPIEWKQIIFWFHVLTVALTIIFFIAEGDKND